MRPERGRETSVGDTYRRHESNNNDCNPGDHGREWSAKAGIGNLSEGNVRRRAICLLIVRLILPLEIVCRLSVVVLLIVPLMVVITLVVVVPLVVIVGL